MSDEVERERIRAWRAERARIAEADKAERIRHKAIDNARAVETIEQDQNTAALTLLASAQPKAEDRKVIEDSKPGVFSRIGNVPLFLVVVVAPVLITALYLVAFATPLYEAQSVIAITKPAENGNGPRSGLLGGVQGPSNLSEVFGAHSYVQSQALMDTLEEELGLVTEFSSDAIDPLQRLRTIPILSLGKEAQFGRFLDSSVDIQSGLLTLYVRAPSASQAVSVSDAVLRSTEIMVQSLGQQVFDQRQSHAAKVREAAEQQVAEAQAALVALQIKYQEVDPKNRVESIYSTINDLEAEAQQLNSEIQKAQIAGIGESLQTRQAMELQERIRRQIEDQRARLVAPDGSTERSLNTLLMEYELATLEVDLAREAVKTALKAQAEAGQEAALNRSLLQVVVPPRAAQTATYPKVPGALALVFVICLTLFAALTMFRAART